jgi:hypothetical protein
VAEKVAFENSVEKALFSQPQLTPICVVCSPKIETITFLIHFSTEEFDLFPNVFGEKQT